MSGLSTLVAETEADFIRATRTMQQLNYHREAPGVDNLPGRNSSMSRGSIIAGFFLCWLLNLAYAGIAWLLFVTSERTLPTGLILLTGIGVFQIAYIVPLFRLLRRRGKPRTAQRVVTAAVITALINLGAWLFIGGSCLLGTWRA